MNPDDIIEIDKQGKVHDPAGVMTQHEPDRALILTAAEMLYGQLQLKGEALMTALSALHLGYQIGCASYPQDYVPAVALRAAEDAKRKAEEYRQRAAIDMREAGVTQALGAIGGRGGNLW